MERNRKDYKHLFEEKLRRESGFSDLEIDWSTYDRTAPVYFRSGDPSVCSSFATISCPNKGLSKLLIYGSLRKLCHKNVHFAMFTDYITLKVQPSATTEVNPV